MAKVRIGKEIDFSHIERKWQKRWEKENAFKVDEKSKKKKFYNLEMYPYPSGSGLHIGHAFNFTLGDIYARFKRMKGYNVLYPTGYDSFGLPAENAAVKTNTHPKVHTDKAIKYFIEQQKALGLSYDWSRMIQSHDPEYYKWDQYFFLQFLKKGLAYRKKSSVNFCPKCNSVLANEQVHNGKCWVHKDVDVEVRHLEQWFLMTSKYADELLDKVKELDWPERIKSMQENWIGRSEGSEIMFEINGEKWPIFTTRADTLFGVTFMVISAQHPRLMELVTDKQKKEVEKFLKKIRSTSEKDARELEKEGVFTGSYAINPMTKEKIPIWVGNFVVADYGSGMVMAVPAHDQRDFEFAKKYNISIKVVVEPVTGTPQNNEEYRKSIVAIVENPENEKLLSINWGKMGGNLFIGGGIENGEDVVKTALREIEEETGYKNLEFISKTETIHHHYFAHSKGVARNIDAIGLYFKLKSTERVKQKLEDNEKNKFSVEWIGKDAVLDKVKDELHKEVFKRLILGEAFTDYGILINSDAFDGLMSDEAKEHITIALKEKKLARKVVQYKLRDWLLSRQRYWGAPIPIVYCDKCGIVPVPEKELPILLPEKVKFGVGNPLTTNKEFLNVKCYKCGGKAKRETDTMDTFFDSSWYYLRFADPQNRKEAFDRKKAEYWMPVDFYVGGAEHACMHLIYARFFTKVLRDLGFLKFDEPFKRLFNQGMVHAEDGYVMSKSRGNVVDPLEVSGKYGVDTLRAFLVSMASPDKDYSWSSTGIESMHRFVIKMYNSLTDLKIGKSSEKMEHKINLAIKQISEDIEGLQHNLAVIKIRALIDSLEDEISKENLEKIVKMVSVFCPHISEEIWEKIGGKGFVSLASWPEVNEIKINEKFEQEEKNMDKVVADVLNVLKIVKEKNEEEAEKVYLYVMPNELKSYDENLLRKRTGKEVRVYAVNDKQKYDPEGKAGKAKPGKPGIYVE